MTLVTSAAPDPAQLLVVEAAASVPPQPGPALAAAVARQAWGETPQSFSERVARMIRGLETEERRLDAAVLFLGDARGDAIAKARYAILRALFSSRVLAPSGRISLVAPRVTDPIAKHDIFALAGAVLAEAGGSRLELEIRLDTRGSTEDATSRVRNARAHERGSRASA